MSDGTFGLGIAIAVGLYLLAMLALGVAARRVQSQNSLSEFYLANRSLGTLVLMLTLYATQYSGNSLLGLPGETYRVGYLWVMSVGFMLSVIVGYLLFAPQLYVISRGQGFVTPGDWIDYRFGSPALTMVASLLFLVVVTNFLLAQLLAIGHVVEALSGGAVPHWVGVVGLGLVIALYETLGGMRAVAWTDCAQGLMILFGLAGIMVVVLPGLEGLSETSLWIMANAPAKAAVPEGGAIQAWFSTIILVAFSASVYPQAIQRIFAAKSARVLRNAVTFMAFMPWVTVMPMFLVGILSISRLSGLEGIEADQVMPQLMRLWAEQSPWLQVMATLVLIGTLAAIMSTADSVLLSLSSIAAKDILGRTWLRQATPERLTRWGKWISWVVMGAMMLYALSPRISLWGLIELKLEVLIQTAPLFILGTLWRGLNAKGALVGILVGTAVGAGLSLAGYGKLWGWHAGVLGLAANLALAVAVSLVSARPRAVATTT